MQNLTSKSTYSGNKKATKKKFTMKMFGRSGSMTFPMSYDFQGEYFDCARKGWKGMSSLEKSLSVSLAITSMISIALMIAVIVVGIQSNEDDCQVIVDRTVLPSSTPNPGSEPTPPVDRCNTTIRPRPPRRNATTEPTTDNTTEEATTLEDDDGLSSSHFHWAPSADCIVSDRNNSTICLAPQCFRMASRIIDSIDFSADPCQNFYQFACGNWIKNNPVPEYAQKWNQHNLQEDRVLREIKDILETEQSMGDSRSLQLAKTFYHSCVHSPDDEVNVAEMKLLLEEMASVEDQSTFNSMQTAATLISNVRRNLNGNYILTLNVDVNDENTTENAIYLDQPILGLPFLLNEMNIEISSNLNLQNIHQESVVVKIRQIFRTLAEKLWFLIYPEEEESNREKVLADIFSFEENLTRILTDLKNVSEPEGPPTFYNLREIDEAELSPTMMSWLSAFVDSVLQNNRKTDQSNSQEEEKPIVLVKNVEYFKGLEILLSNTNAKVIENYIKLRVLLSYGLHGSQAFQRIFGEFKQAIMASELPIPRWKTCSRLANQFFGWTLSRKFLTVFDEIAKIQLNLTMSYLKEAFNESLDGSEWIGNNDTKQYAESKIQLMQTFLGFPDLWHDATSQDFVNSFVENYYLDMNFTDASNYFQNYIEASMWASKKRLTDIYEPTLEGSSMIEWPKPHYPTEILSHYAKNQNYLVVPAGVVDHSMPLMDSTFPSVHYGSLGVKFAENMLSAIVGNGRFRQLDGSIGSWWDNATVTNYEGISTCFKDQLSETEMGTDLNLRHSIFTTGALSLAYRAFQSQSFDREFDEVLLPGLQDYDSEQLFFLSFAQTQCSHEAHAHLRSHERSPRVLLDNVLSNSVYFAKHWNCPLPNEDRVCRIL